MVDTRQQLEQFINKFVSEPDRAAAIVGASRIDAILIETSAHHLLPCRKGNDNFISGSDPYLCFRRALITAIGLGL